MENHNKICALLYQNLEKHVARDVLNLIEEDNRKLTELLLKAIDVVEVQEKSLATYGEHPIIENQVAQLKEKIKNHE